jgi:hypothetical protein
MVLFQTIPGFHNGLLFGHFAANDSQFMYGGSHFPQLFVSGQSARHCGGRGLFRHWSVGISFVVGLDTGWEPNTTRTVFVHAIGVSKTKVMILGNIIHQETSYRERGKIVQVPNKDVPVPIVLYYVRLEFRPCGHFARMISKET